MNIAPKFNIVTANKTDKNAIKRFYKKANTSFSYMGLDVVFLVIHGAEKDIDESSVNNAANVSALSENIVGGVVLSQLTPDNHQYLLHALFIDTKYRGQGLSTFLLEQVTNWVAHKAQEKLAHKVDVIAFAENSLESFYYKQGYQKLSPEHLSLPLLIRYQSYLKKQPRLHIFKR